jgi:hypothetical protein
MTLRAKSEIHHDRMIHQRKLDAIPVKMHWGLGVYQALNSGVLDEVFVNIDDAYNLKLHQTAR